MNKFLGVFIAVLLCAAMAMATYPRSHYHTSHKTHLGGAGYAYHPVKYSGHGVVYRKPVVHHAAPIVYAHKHLAKPRVTHYIKPSYHHEVPHVAPVYHSKPVYYLGGHTSHGIAYKPAVHSHGYAYKPAHHGHGISYIHKGHY